VEVVVVAAVTAFLNNVVDNIDLLLKSITEAGDCC
jgi:hypothetical protein